MIHTGIDMISISRIKAACKPRFLERVFTEGEREYASGKRMKYKRLAGRFAAKEACSKAFTTGFDKGIGWKDIEVVNTAEGRPGLRFHAQAKKLIGDRKAFLSISYSKDTAVALVMIES